MTINPVSSVSPLNDIIKKSNASQSSADGNLFGDMIRDLVNNVNETDRTANQDTMNVATGNSDDLHNIMINSQKSELAVLTMVEVRNKILDAYNEIMRVTL